MRDSCRQVQHPLSLEGRGLTHVAGPTFQITPHHRPRRPPITTQLEGLGDLRPRAETALRRLARDRVIERIWRRDHTVWHPQPTEIADRLAWLDAPAAAAAHLPALSSFAAALRATAVNDVVLLGMGGSSLGPEVLRQVFPSAPGFPRLTVLDSTVPAWVRRVSRAVDPASTLFLLSSKSGGTIEVLSLYRHFRGLVETAAGPQAAGSHFAAVTDPGTSLAALAQRENFRRIWVNEPNIGGRYSVLSLFGLVPASIIGMDLPPFLAAAVSMARACGPDTPQHENPGATLGAALASLALAGRDKLTLVTSPALAGFGLWVEQLIAESTGKVASAGPAQSAAAGGKGIIPIAGEPLLPPSTYGSDRLFVSLRLAGDSNDALDAHVDRLAAAGHPVLRLSLADRHALGGEFFRWEFATAVAGAVLGINPFDQPNVQQAKDLTGKLLDHFQEEGSLPPTDISGSVDSLLAQARPGDYLAILAFVQPSPALEHAVDRIRRRVMERPRIATTFGYGPRYLHSTGQLHKGGPPSGLFLHIAPEPDHPLPIPGAPYDFGILAQAQALGDLHALHAAGRRIARISLAEALRA
ncbi:MAG: glucose-6-phosphate isomerase [Dehalococcoidia bacterium]|nr:glucose-6-phosphate isomerase [Dehalococcoidia bacterium]